MSKDRARPFSRKHRRYWIPVTGGMILIGLINLAIGFYLYAGAPKDAPRTTTAQVIERHRDRVQALLDRAAALHEPIAAAPTTEARPGRAVALVDQGGDTALVHLEDLGGRTSVSDELRIPGGEVLLDCAGLLRDGRTAAAPEPDPALADDRLRSCEQVQVLAVVRTRELDEPADSTGSAAGDLLYVALDSGAVLGGFAWDTGAGKDVPHSQVSAETRAALLRNLASRIDGAIRRGLTR